MQYIYIFFAGSKNSIMAIDEALEGSMVKAAFWVSRHFFVD